MGIHVLPQLAHYWSSDGILGVNFVSKTQTCKRRNMYRADYAQSRRTYKSNCPPWNYSVAGHGKGPCDGVGAALKRRLNDFVAHGNDLVKVEDVIKLLQNKTKVAVYLVDDSKIKEAQELKETLVAPAIPGILNLHQIVWIRGEKRVTGSGEYLFI